MKSGKSFSPDLRLSGVCGHKLVYFIRTAFYTPGDK